MPLAFTQQALLTNATAGTGTPYDTLGTAREMTAWIIGNGTTITAGDVFIEGAHDAAYAGTWELLHTVTPIPGRVIPRRISGMHRAIRARINGTITGTGSPSVTVLLDGNEEE